MSITGGVQGGVTAVAERPPAVRPKPSKVWKGDLVITTAGDVITDYEVHGRIIPKAPNWMVSMCTVLGPDPGTPQPTYATALIDSTNANATGGKVMDVYGQPQVPSVWFDFILGHDLYVRQVEARHIIDGFGIYNTHGPDANWDAAGFWIHDHAWFAHDPAHGGGPDHGDGCQVQEGLNVKLRDGILQGNNDVAAFPGAPANTNTSIMVSENFAPKDPIGNLDIQGLWLGGGLVASVNMSSKGQVLKFGTIANNRFLPSARQAQFPIIHGSLATGVLTGNVWDDTGAPVLVNGHGGN